MEIIGRDKITQHSAKAFVKINNKSERKYWYQTWWGQILIGLTVLVVGAFCTKLLKLS